MSEKLYKLKSFHDGTSVVFDRGSFDNYRVSFYCLKGRHIKSPKDVEFLNYFLSIGENEKVWSNIYSSFRSINSKTKFNEVIFPKIKGTVEEEKYLSAYAAALIAEERKANTRLGKLVKFIALHQVLMQDWDSYAASKWSYGRKWTEIAAECEKYEIKRY